MKTLHSNIEEYCPIAEASKIVGDFWSILIIRELLNGCKRFGELQEKISGITNSTLSDRLKSLVNENVAIRNQYDCIPPKVEYSLTHKGMALQSIIEELERFGNNWMKNRLNN